LLESSIAIIYEPSHSAQCVALKAYLQAELSAHVLGIVKMQSPCGESLPLVHTEHLRVFGSIVLQLGGNLQPWASKF